MQSLSDNLSSTSLGKTKLGVVEGLGQRLLHEVVGLLTHGSKHGVGEVTL